MTWYFDNEKGIVTDTYNPNCEPLKICETKFTKSDRETKQQQTIKAKAVWVEKHKEIYND